MLRIVSMLSLAVGAVAATAAGHTAPLRASVVAPPTQMQVYKSPTCGCCKAWVAKMREAGFDVRVTDLDDAALQAEKAKRGVGDNLASCHTAVVNGYIVEGHVPAADIQRMLQEKPAVAGLAAPGMPRGSPGMEMGGAKDAYDVVAFTKLGKTYVFAHH